MIYKFWVDCYWGAFLTCNLNVPLVLISEGLYFIYCPGTEL